MTLADARVRRARVDDIDAVVELEATCLGADAWSRGLVGEGISQALPTVSYLVAELDGEVVAHAVVSLAGDDAELQRIAVAPSYRRSGLASELLAEIERLAGDAGAGRLLLEVREDNVGAAAFYRARGFTEVGRRPAYYRDGAAAVVLGKQVDRGGPVEAGS